jgi:replicative DNA helicase
MDNALFNIEAEEAILGAILIDSSAITYVADRLKPHHFARDKNEWVYSACCKLYFDNQRVDELTVAHELSQQKKLEELGGVAFLSGLVAKTATVVGIEYYAEIIIKLASRRALKLASKKIEELGDLEDTEKAYGQALAIIMNIWEAGKDTKARNPKERAEYALDRYTSLKDGDNTAVTWFGIKSLDKFGGMQAGNTVIIAGPSGKGKTTLATQISLHVAKTHGPVLFVSLEMSEEETIDRDIARLTENYVLKIMRGNYDEQTWGSICDSIGPLSEENISYAFPTVSTIPMIYIIARRMQIQQGLAMVVIDYIQLLKDASGGRNMDESLTNISHDIKRMARELGVPVIALSQENRDRNAPILDRTRGSGTISHDASWVLYLERGDTQPETSKLTIAKQRQGGANTEIELTFDWKKQRYLEESNKVTKEA